MRGCCQRAAALSGRGGRCYTSPYPMAPTAVEYETIIGLEVHAQLLTRSKMFCPCSISYADSPPNTYVCPDWLGMPGVLPVINKRAVEMTLMTGLALNCEIPAQAKFDRKNYPYPDLMKGYQISEYDQPLCTSGWLEIEVEDQRKHIGITRVHLEEDTAKLMHVKSPTGETYSLVDVNRSGVPLMEIVSEPDMRSPEEARAYLVKLRPILRYLAGCAGNREEGNCRCDANVSIRPLGASGLGGKVEVKNMNSFRSVYRALHYEVERQREVVDGGGRIPQETRGWVDDQGVTVSQRSKEEADDYRYFPEPDLPPIVVDREWLDRIRTETAELPDAKRARLEAEDGLSASDAVRADRPPGGRHHQRQDRQERVRGDVRDRPPARRDRGGGGAGPDHRRRRDTGGHRGRPGGPPG